MSSNVFGRNILFLILVNLIIKPGYIFGIEAQVQNMVGPENYGTYFALFNFCFLFLIILDPGISNYNSQWLSRNREQVENQLSKVFSVKLILSGLFLVVLMIAGKVMNYPQVSMSLLMLIGVNFLLASIYAYLKSHFPALGKYHLESLFSVLDKVIAIVILGFMIYVRQEMTIEIFIYSLMVSYVISIVLALVKLSSLTKIKFQFSFDNIKSILALSIGFGLISLFMSIYNRVDGVMLERMLQDDGYQAGIYAAGYRLLDASNMFAFLFASLLLPMFSNIISKKESVVPLLKSSYSLMICFCVGVSTIGYFYSEQIMDLIYVEYDQVYASNFRWLILSFMAVGLTYIFGTLIAANGKLFHLNVLFVIAILLNFSLNLWLIPKLQSEGAAITTLITQVLVVLGEIGICVYLFKLKPDYLLLVKTILFVAISGIAAYFLSQSSWNWMISCIISSIIIILASFLLGIIRWNTIILRKPISN